MTHTKTNAAIILAAGNGLRFGSQTPKQYMEINGIPLIKKTVANFLNHKNDNKTVFSPIIVVISVKHQTLCKHALGELSAFVDFVEGGVSRQESTLNALIFLKQHYPKLTYVHIHDGARPFISKYLLDNILKTLKPHIGVIPALPITETIKEINEDEFIKQTIPRERLYAAQTPQSFPFAKILRAHEHAAKENDISFTDDSAIAEHYGLPVKCIAGESQNVKITWKGDMEKVNQDSQEKVHVTTNTKTIFPDIRTGNGYDIHQLGEGNGVILCGIKIPYSRALQGHSDADVGLHALTDALLATCGAGDIGVHFPPTDPKWRGVASEVFLKHAVKILSDNGGHIVNIDITLIAEEPKIKPHRPIMIRNLQSLLNISENRISVKATTNEKLGPIGRHEGIAAIATANVYYE